MKIDSKLPIAKIAIEIPGAAAVFESLAPCPSILDNIATLAGRHARRLDSSRRRCAVSGEERRPEPNDGVFGRRASAAVVTRV